jgi:hypothetical protein
MHSASNLREQFIQNREPHTTQNPCTTHPPPNKATQQQRAFQFVHGVSKIRALHLSASDRSRRSRERDSPPAMRPTDDFV